MERQGLVEGYVRGDITRRTFVRRLTATGVGLGAALSYAQLLRPATADAYPGEHDFYEEDDYYETKLAPDVITEAPVAISHDRATGRAQIDPNKQRTQVWFEFGPEGGQRRSSAQVVLNDGDDLDRRVTIPLTGLKPSTTYLVRPVGKNGSGRTVGADFAFTTGAAPVAAAPVAAAAAVVPPPEPPKQVTPPPADVRGATLSGVKTTATLKQVLRSGVLPIEVTTDEDALLELTATMRQQVRGVRAAATRTRKVTVATGRVGARGGRPTTAKLKIKRAARRALKNRTAATLQLEIRATDRSRNKSLQRQAIRLK